MIIGNGLIANIFINTYLDNENILIFASGVSNSKETDEKEFNREYNLIKKHIKTKLLFIYFSTTSIYSSSAEKSKYILHKLRMERYIRENCNKYLIIRAANIMGKRGNKTNLINFLFDSINNEIPFNLWENTYRNILDVEDFREIVSVIIENGNINKTIAVQNITSVRVSSLVIDIENFLKKKAVYVLKPKKDNYNLETKHLKKIIPKNIQEKISNKNYFINILHKYYG